MSSIAPTTSTQKALGEGARAHHELIDCDIHNMLPSPAALAPYLSQRWRRYHERFGLRQVLETQYWVTTTHVQAARVASAGGVERRGVHAEHRDALQPHVLPFHLSSPCRTPVAVE